MSRNTTSGECVTFAMPKNHAIKLCYRNAGIMILKSLELEQRFCVTKRQIVGVNHWMCFTRGEAGHTDLTIFVQLSVLVGPKAIANL